MKHCPKCLRGYGNEMYYCLLDGSYLTDGDPQETLVSPVLLTEPLAVGTEEPVKDLPERKTLIQKIDAGVTPDASPQPAKTRRKSRRIMVTLILLIIFAGLLVGALLLIGHIYDWDIRATLQ